MSPNKRIIKIPDKCKKCAYCKNITPIHLANGQPLQIPISQAIQLGWPVVMYDYQCELNNRYIKDVNTKVCKIVRVIEEEETT